MSRDKQADSYEPEEAQRRFETLVNAALNTPPRPLKDAPRKRGEAKGGEQRRPGRAQK